MSGRQQTVRLERVRTFGRVLTDTRNMVRDNFAVFFKTILFMAGPFVLLTCALESFYSINIFSRNTFESGGNRMGSYLMMNHILWQLRWAINGFVIAVIVSHFIKVYREKGQGKFDFNDVGRSIRKDFAGIFLAVLVLFGGVVLLAIVIGYLMYGLSEVSVGGAIAFFFAGWLAYILIRYPFWYFVFSVLVARTTREKPMNVISAMGLAGKAMSGNWWMTWVIFFVMWIILWLLGFAISLPAELAGNILKLFSITDFEATDDYKLLITVLTSIGEFAKTIVSSVFCVSVALQFYSLKEKLDGEGTKKLVDTIGTNNDDDGIELTY